MKAIVCTKYGPPEVLQLQEVEQPKPKNNELLIKNFATAVTSSDTIVRGFKLPKWSTMGIMMRLALGFSKPRNPILGMVLAGEVEELGKDVKKFKKGDRVVCTLTGHGLKDPDNAIQLSDPPVKVKATIPAVEEILKGCCI